MKIRSDFVTNSSSSSFIVFRFKSKYLADIVNRFYDELSKISYLNEFEVIDDVVNYDDEIGWYETPNSLAEALNIFVDVVSDRRTDTNAVSKLMTQEILENFENILNDMEEAEVTIGEQGWGEDEARYNQDNYNEEDLRKIYKNIAEENNISEEDVTTEMFDEYVGCDPSTLETTMKYNKKDGKEKISIKEKFSLG